VGQCLVQILDQYSMQFNSAPSNSPLRRLRVGLNVRIKEKKMMEKYIIFSVPTLLLLSTLMFWTLIPGGPVETRKFGHYSPFILGTFNTFLTILGFGSLVVVYFCFSGDKWAFYAAGICGISYLLVYALDLGKIFPVSRDKMSQSLFVIEATGLILSIPLTLLSFMSASMLENVNDHFEFTALGIILLLLVAIIGTGIVIFATKATMKK